MVRDRTRRKFTFLAVVLTGLSAAGCQQKTAKFEDGDGLNTASTTPVSYQATADLGKAWQSDPKNVNKGLAYANALESIGQAEQQMEVYKSLTASHPENAKLQGLYGKKLLQSGRSGEAVAVLEQAAAGPTPGWRVHSALGSAYDQQGLYAKAREQYRMALAESPDNLGVLNNLGMSFALEGNLKEAETTLRRTDALPRSRSEPRIRQNLALVVGLQGRFDEASQIASQDLPQDQVEANMAYLKKMLSQPNTWQQISESAEG